MGERAFTEQEKRNAGGRVGLKEPILNIMKQQMKNVVEDLETFKAIS